MYYRYPEGEFFFEVNIGEDLEFDEFIELDSFYRTKKDECKDKDDSNKECSCIETMNFNEGFHIDLASLVMTNN